MQLNFFNKPHFENGSLKKISEVLKAQGIKRPLICTDPGLSSIGMTDKIRNLLSNELSPTFYEETQQILQRRQLMKHWMHIKLTIVMG